MAEGKGKEDFKSKNNDKGDFPALSHIEPIEEIETQIRQYKLLSTLGEGGFGIVYRAEQKSPMRRQVALKVIKPGMDSKQVIARFESERQALALLDHPSIAHIFDGGMTESGQPYFVMELVVGHPITKYCDQQKLNIEERLKLFQQVCEAVQHSHQKGIIHRDIKPSNILVSVQSGKPVPMIIDFGVAKAVSRPLTERTLFTEQGQFIGTPEYMSPEQAGISIEDIDTRSDIYSLGVVLYELLSGTLPFTREELRQAGFVEIQRIIHESDPPRPSTRLSSLGEEAITIAEKRSTQITALTKRMQKELEWIPLKAMRKERERRYQTASELADDISNYLNGNPLKAGPESAMYIFKKFVRRHRYTSTVAGLLLLVILSFSCIGVYLLVKTREAQKDFDSIKSEWSEVSENMFRLYRQVGFMQFLELWHEGKDADAKLIADFLSDGSKEKRGAMFLLDPRSVAEKEENLRREFPDETNWFADFLIGEQQLKSGFQQDALEAYNRSYKSIQLLSQHNRSFLDTLLNRHLMSRLYTLENLNKSARDVSSSEGGD